MYARTFADLAAQAVYGAAARALITSAITALDEPPQEAQTHPADETKKTG